MAIFDQHIDSSLLNHVKERLNDINQTTFDMQAWPPDTYRPNTWLIRDDELIMYFEHFWPNIYIFGAGDDWVTPCLCNFDPESATNNPGLSIRQKYAECGIKKFTWTGRFQNVTLKNIPHPNISYVLRENDIHIRRCEEIILDKIEPDIEYALPGYPKSIVINDAGVQYGSKAAEGIASEFARRQFFNNMRLMRVTAYIAPAQCVQFKR